MARSDGMVPSQEPTAGEALRSRPLPQVLAEDKSVAKQLLPSQTRDNLQQRLNREQRAMQQKSTDMEAFAVRPLSVMDNIPVPYHQTAIELSPKSTATTCNEDNKLGTRGQTDSTTDIPVRRASGILQSTENLSEGSADTRQAHRYLSVLQYLPYRASLRAKKYASYVQELSCNGYIQVHESVYQTLRARGLSPVFPNLRALNWWGSEEELSVLIPKGSRILSLYVSLDPYNPRHIAVRKLQSLLDGLPAYAPDVKQLLLTKIPVDLSLHAISEFKSLNIVRLSSKTRSRKSRQVRPYAYSWVTWDILRAMAPFHRFRKLDIEVSNLFLPSDSAFLEFSELEELKLNGHMANVMADSPAYPGRQTGVTGNV
ncbi:hypothetical protein GLOTRDRAFT_129404 [Gloeophyllum trabeum ATCC 11539]|uniref:Uncharacterized protein n=1 Tax=Gloeophyllum trabeum (strain ATCC 11539 / FP-39264 / Madison 617) TaxID=670483 RepID=S7Q6H3_GLOTA|nr:uncharacterized protein GLOTRDRAFT_129404 [Gloeophyllum trabeum ATCC 11539]EPQ55112.1 hypothetical protein GLOTRDRAFT_129404 [Gloeophyllum trabeum ATCC 11539]